MSVPPPPPGPPAGGFFGGPVQPPIQPSVPQYGFAAPAPVFGGYTPPATVGAPPATSRTPAGPRTPEPVTVACSLLGVFAAIGAFTVLAVLMLSSGSGSSSSGSSSSAASDIGIGAVYALLWGGSGFINVALIVFLRQGNAMARILTSVVCGLWALYWLKLLFDLSNAGDSSILVLGSIVHLGEILLIGLVVASVLPAVLLWRGSSQEHFG